MLLSIQRHCRGVRMSAINHNEKSWKGFSRQPVASLLTSHPCFKVGRKGEKKQAELQVWGLCSNTPALISLISLSVWEQPPAAVWFLKLSGRRSSHGTMGLFSFLSAVVTRALFILVSLVAVWRVTWVKGNPTYWLLTLLFLPLVAEMIITLMKRKGLDYKW